MKINSYDAFKQDVINGKTMINIKIERIMNKIDNEIHNIEKELNNMHRDEA